MVGDSTVAYGSTLSLIFIEFRFFPIHPIYTYTDMKITFRNTIAIFVSFLNNLINL